MSFLGLNWENILLIIFTHFLVVTDRAFSKKVRREFQLALFSCLLLTMLDQHFQYSTILVSPFTVFAHAFEGFLRAFILCMLVYIASRRKKRDIYTYITLLPLVFVVVGLCFSTRVFCYIAIALYAVTLMVIIVRKHSRRDRADIAFAIFLSIMFALAIAAEGFIENKTIVNNCLSVITCVYYFFFVMRTYKKDRLTGLLLRHNLGFELEDNLDKAYDIVLIDVDNFKLINDKYGHDKGDEVLITIVDTTLKHLPGGCRMYRYGGDEFVIISRKVTTEKLISHLEDTNDELSASDLRMSYGVVRHEPGVPSEQVITEADKAMYENKRLIKSEDIWDAMTGLYNLRGFLEELDTFRRAVNRDGHMVCLIGVDIERLSNINKAFGYSEGNLIITVLAKSMKQCLHGRNFIGHLGSDEFVMAVEVTDQDDASIPLVISQLLELVDTSHELATKDYSVKLNVDRYYINLEDAGPSEDYVNELLYMKQEDKDNRRKSDLAEVDQDFSDKDNEIVQDILNNNRLQYAFQPIVSAKDGTIVAYESLMRSDTETAVSPLKILKYAERSQRSYDVEKLTLFNSLEKFATNKDVPENAKIFINSLPGHLLNDVDFDVLKSRYGHLFGRMVLEITEQREIDDDALVVLNTRREKNGFELAIDDYGSGVSNTNNLLRYTPEVVKIDRLLITGIDRNSKKQFFVNSIIAFAKDNDMLTLAEGVETEHELKTLIKLGIDLIQGYITAKPSVEIITSIPDNIRKIIVSENMKVKTNSRMIYTAGDNCELSVVSLAMEDYSKINISAEKITLTGSPEYTADMTVKIMDNTDCTLSISDICLNSVDDLPCIELGENCNVLLYLKGNNRLNSKGIYVPESSSLTIKDGGNLSIFVKAHECYAIGSDSTTPFGKITLKASGLITLNVDGVHCVGVGGGIAGENSEVNLLSGTVHLTVAGEKAVGFGSYKGDVPIKFKDTALETVFRVSEGLVFGSYYGLQNIDFKNFTMDISGSGTDITVVGSPEESKGQIRFDSGSLKSKFSGHNITFIGGGSGDVGVDITHCSMNLLGEGDSITGFGTRSSEAKLTIRECSMQLTINASSPIAIGAAEKEIKYIGPEKSFLINGVDSEIYNF